MLIEKPLEAGGIVAVKLISGEEILATVQEINTTYIKISKPLTLVLTGHGGQGMVAMAPFVLGMDEDARLTIELSKVITYSRARSDAAAQYRQLTSNIQVAQSVPSSLVGIN